MFEPSKSESRILRDIRSEELTDYAGNAKSDENPATDMENSLHGSVAGRMQR
jgi:hypothetical protein